MKYLLAVFFAVLIVAMVTRAGSVWRLLLVLLGLALVYTVLKLSGVIDSFDPRAGAGIIGGPAAEERILAGDDGHRAFGPG